MLSSLAVNAELPDLAGPVALVEVARHFLLRAQNNDGAWPYQPGLHGAVEPTCWALIALKDETGAAAAVERGLSALAGCQLPDGSWPSRPDQPTGCWATSLASLALFQHRGDCEAVRRGVSWICSAWPAEGGLWWQVRNWLRPTAPLTRQNSAYRGWSWTPGAASWVEPTAYALILLDAVSAKLHPPSAANRKGLGEAMLWDRMCPGGGWNSGNPLVYGVAGVRRVGPTAWALLALRAHANRAESRQSLDWLEQEYPRISGPLSLTLAHICLEAYRRGQDGFAARLGALYETNRFLESVPAAAMSLMALNVDRARLFASGSGRSSAL